LRASQVGQANVNGSKLKAFGIPLPPPEEQIEILKRINSAFARADRLEAEAARARALLHRLEAAVLAKAFKGELVPQDPNDEPASVLIERIRAQRAQTPKGKQRGHSGSRRTSKLDHSHSTSDPAEV
jgi:type I restriction enzyme, S subunit